MATARPYFLWAVRHNNASSVREGCGRHRASGVNLLTFDAIFVAELRFVVHVAVIVAFLQRKANSGLQDDASSSKSQYEKSR
jgi:hypothetical protein